MLAAAGLFCGCHSSKKTAETTMKKSTIKSSISSREWVLRKLIGFPDSTVAKFITPISLRLANDSTISGKACNNFSGTIAMASKTLKVSELISTKKYCDGGIMEIEGHFFATLKSAETYKLDGHFLRFYKGDKLILEFLATDWD